MPNYITKGMRGPEEGGEEFECGEGFGSNDVIASISERSRCFKWFHETI
jgi:hypothetical protein